MALRVTPEIDFSRFPESDGEPMAETVANMIQMTNLIYALRVLLETQGRTQVAVGGNQFLYYNPHNGRDHVSPDVYAALDVEPGNRPTWKTWEEGKCPDVVFEISSPSTRNQDLGFERGLYARLGAREYYIYDPQHEMEPPFLGYQLRGGRLEPMTPLPGGGVASALLGAELRPMGTYLRVIDPATGEPFREPDEERRDRILAENRALAAEDRALVAEDRALVAEDRALTVTEQSRLAEQRAADEAQARLAAEERARQAEAALREALAELARRQQQSAMDDHDGQGV